MDEASACHLQFSNALHSRQRGLLLCSVLFPQLLLNVGFGRRAGVRDGEPPTGRLGIGIAAQRTRAAVNHNNNSTSVLIQNTTVAYKYIVGGI